MHILAAAAMQQQLGAWKLGAQAAMQVVQQYMPTAAQQQMQQWQQLVLLM
jgi:hypothetical protein